MVSLFSPSARDDGSFELELRLLGDRAYVSPKGTLGSAQVRRLRSEGMNLLAIGFRWLIVDLRDTGPIGTAEATALAELDKRAERYGARVAVVGAEPTQERR